MHHKYNTRGAENATMSDDLKIKPEFRDLIPKLTDEEFAQLEENILEAGEVKEPIIVWNGFIVDGHHRWYIVQKHPEIPYKIEEMDFDNEHAAMAWASRNQLGRRNLTDEESTYLRGIKYQEEKLAHGGDRGNQYTKEASHQNEDLPKGRTAERVAKELGVGKATVERSEKFAQGVDIADSIKPGIKDDILKGNINMPKAVMQRLPKANPEKQKQAVELISEGKIQEAQVALEDDTLSGLYDTGAEVQYTEDDLRQELEENFDAAMDGLKTTRDIHDDLMGDPEINNRIIDLLIELHEAEIIGLREEKL